MTSRRDFFMELAALGVFPTLAPSLGATGVLNSLLERGEGQGTPSTVDKDALAYWSGFLGRVGTPVTSQTERQRGGPPDLRPVFLHYGTQGFRYAVDIDASELVKEGDISVALNTSTLKVARKDQEIFDDLENAQVRFDVAQKTAMLPVLEQMAYMAVSGMVSVKAQLSSNTSKTSSTAKGAAPAKSGGGQKASSGNTGAVQNIAFDSSASWQKMQNIILPQGQGLWALHLEAQKKESLLHKVLQHIITEAGQFAPLISLPGIALSALQSFNQLYGAIQERPVRVMASDPTPVFATQDAVPHTAAPGAATGIMLSSGTYVLIPTSQIDMSTLKNLTVKQGRIVPASTQPNQLDAAAADTLPDVTYVTFDVQVKSTRILGGSSGTVKG